MKERVIIFGGDGFCGWPTALHLSNAGYDIIIVDNLSRRKIDIELDAESLTPIKSIQKRIETWQKISGNEIIYYNFDISLHYKRLLELFETHKPKAVVHFAEQRSAPYSMKTPYHKRYTINNNTNATHNICCAIVESQLDIHLIHLGTTGYYGYSSVGLTIPEGYLNVKVEVDGDEKNLEIAYPPNPGSIYHLTKCMDPLIFAYYNKNDTLRITDLHQGIVYGTQTEQTRLHDDLINRFDYCGDYGTVLNRFIMQSQCGHPLTVHGTGGQTRAFIHLQDTVRCVKMALQNPPNRGQKVKILNQTSECMNILELAEKISAMTNTEIRFYRNPRNEDPANELKFDNTGFKALGWDPIMLEDSLMSEIIDIAKRYKDRCDISKIICTSVWNDHINIDNKGSELPVK